jgi:hypothetical protein
MSVALSTSRAAVLAPSGGPATYQAAIAAAASKVVWYKLDEASGTSAADAAGSRTATHSGTVTVGSTSLITAGAGKAATYGGGRTTVASDAGLQLTGSLSIEALIKPTTIPGTGQAWVLSKDNSYGLGFHNGKLAFLIRDTGGTFNYLDTPLAGDVVTGTKYHVCGTWDSVALVQRLYINGALKITGGALGFGVNSNVVALSIGDWPSGGEPFTGVIDEVVLYNATLAGATVAAHAALA